MKKRISLTLCIVFVALVCITSFHATPPPPPPNDIPDYEYAPPIVEKIWVQKLSNPLANGSNVFMRIQFTDADPALPSEMRIYTNDSDYVVFHDDGIEPDSLSGDKIYGAFLNIDANAFVTEMAQMEQTLTNKGSFINFTGHLGEEISTIPHFDATAFNNNQLVEVNAYLINGIDCGTALFKQNSLLITDLSVVEDLSRTFNVTASGSSAGTALGVWTFGYMMKNMAGTSVTPKNFVKSWVRNWIYDQTVNSQTVAKRLWAIKFMIEPWLRKAKNNSSLTINENNWESEWDGTNETSLLTYAPFKLTAIVNRIDLRGNSSYAKSVTNSGETRFIFSLVSTYTDGSIPHEFVTGKPPKNADQIRGTFPDFIDWMGMNVIFEYGNVQTSRCDLKSFAQSWLDLSQYTSFPNSSFNTDLATITNTVTAQNAFPGKPNGSAINRIRTNERIFFVTDQTTSGWNASDWEFRQFEIDPNTGLLSQVPLTNTPVIETNYSQTLYKGGGNYYVSFPSTTKGDNLIDWVFASPITRAQLYKGTHKIPLNYPGTGDYMLAGGASVDGEYVHHWDLKWWDAITPHYNYTTMTLNNNPYEKQMRQQLSLNTCQGCHNGETKTVFTQVRPLGYGESANYWGTIPDNTVGGIDVRFASNNGSTSLPSGSVANYPQPSGAKNYVNVSPFLTGRNYTSLGDYQDDYVDATEDTKDASMDGLFYVYDPTNDGNNTYPLPQPPRWGYNDLERRKQDLCLFINTECNLTLTPMTKLIVGTSKLAIKE